MRLKLLALALCTLATAGCVNVNITRDSSLAGFDPTVVRRPDPRLPKVFVDRNNFLVVDQEPIRIFSSDNGRVTLSWELDATSPYTFPPNAITFRRPAEPARGYESIVPAGIECAVGAKAKVFTCSFNVPRGKWQTKYAVRVTEGARELEALDPTIYGDM